MADVRPPAVAGSFYERSANALRRSLEGCFGHDLGPGHLPQLNASGPGAILGLVSPHAGYMYSGPAAAHGYAALAADGVPDTIVLLGPSHYVSDRRAALSTASAWRTPLGDAALDQDFCSQLLAATDLVAADEYTHTTEHSLEVQVPFLQFIYADRLPGLVPICLRSHPWGDVEELIADAEALGTALAQVAGRRRLAVIASSDFSHQVPEEEAKRQDGLALEAILARDPARLLHTVASHRISTCGPIPVAVMLFFCAARGGAHAELLRYYTSGDIIGDKSAVVGYASVVVRREGGAS